LRLSLSCAGQRRPHHGFRSFIRALNTTGSARRLSRKRKSVQFILDKGQFEIIKGYGS